jgi:hypothetical protein
MEYSNFVNYSTDMCRSCPCTYYVPIYRQVSSLNVDFVRVRVSSSIPASSLWSVRSQNSVDCWWCACLRCILRVLLACRARDFCGLGIGFVFLLFLSVWFRRVSVKAGTLGFCYGCGDCFSWCLGGFDWWREWCVISWCWEEGRISDSLDFLYS